MNSFEKGNLAQKLNGQEISNLDQVQEYTSGQKFGLENSQTEISDSFCTKKNCNFSSLPKLSEESKKIINKKIESYILKALQKKGFLNTVEGNNVFDFHNFDANSFIGNLSRNIYIGKIDKDLRLKDVVLNNRDFFHFLQNILVVDKEEFINHSDNPKKRNIIGMSESAEDFFDFSKIKNFGFDEDKSNTFSFDNDEEIVAKNGDKISIFEVKAFQRIFGRLKAKRDKDGQLIISRDGDSDFVKFNMETLRRYAAIFSKDKDILTIENIINKCPNLFRLNLLKLEDFNINTQQYSGELLRKEFELSDKAGAKYVMIRGARYYIGRQFFEYKNEDGDVDKISTDQLKVVLLDRDHAGIVKVTGNKEELRYVWDLVSIEDKEAKKQEIRSRHDNALTNRELRARLDFGKDELARLLEKWNITTSCPPKENESNEDYFNRIKNIGSYEYIKNVGDKFSKKARIGIHNLSWKEQQWLASAYYELENGGELFDFAKKYGLDGLSTFVSCEDNVSNAHKILEIGELLDKKISNKSFNNNVFERYSKILSVTDEIISSAKLFFEDYLSEDFNERQLRTKLLSSSSKGLDILFNILKGKNNESELKDSIIGVLDDFDNISKDKIQTLAVLKNILKELSDFQAEERDENKITNFVNNSKEKINKLLFEQDTAVLSESFVENVGREILETSAEIPKTNKRVYIPVGITSDPYNFSFEKPMDAIGLLFWLNNQGQKIDLIVAGSIQRNNYKILHPEMSQEEIETSWQKITRKNIEWYRLYIKRFNLKNINIVNYEDVKSDTEVEDASSYVDESTRKDPGLQSFFEQTVEQGVVNKAKKLNPGLDEKEIKRGLSEYSKEEVDFIMGLNGLKISHQKEFRYDVIARILSAKRLLEENIDDVKKIIYSTEKISGVETMDLHIKNLSFYLAYLDGYSEEYKTLLYELAENEEEINILINSISALKRNIEALEQDLLKLESLGSSSDFRDMKENFRAIKENALSTNREKLENYNTRVDLIRAENKKLKDKIKEYLKSSFEEGHINKIFNNLSEDSKMYRWKQHTILRQYGKKAQEIKNCSWFDKARLTRAHYVRSVTGKSYEMRINVVGDNSGDAVSEERIGDTELYRSLGGNAILDSNQIMATKNESAIAKFLLLSRDSQLEYFKNIEFLLANYYKSISLNSDTAKIKFMEDFKDIKTIPDALSFIQRKIVQEQK